MIPYPAVIAGMAALLSSASATTTITTTTNATVPTTGFTGCDALAAAGLSHRLLLPTDPGYEPQISTWWALNARQHPYCLFLPQTTAEVSAAMVALFGTTSDREGTNQDDGVSGGAGDWHVAVRSGGHGVDGFSNVESGVTIDLSHMNASAYDAAINVASVRPGARWEKVYADLEREHGVTVAGGRDGGVGVGGFLLGGGLSFYSNELGLGCDTVVGYEVVLANGTVVEASSSNTSSEAQHTDLWRALRGGGANFGIVTRFDLSAISPTSLFYDLRMYAATPTNTDAMVSAVADFADQPKQTNEKNALVTFWSYSPEYADVGGILACLIHANTAANSSLAAIPPSLAAVKDLPAVLNQTSHNVSMAAAAAGSKVPAGDWQTGTTLTMRNDPALLERVVDLHRAYVEDVITSAGGVPADAFSTYMFLQPLPAYWGGIPATPNMLGLEAMFDGDDDVGDEGEDGGAQNGIIFTLSVTLNGTLPADEAARYFPVVEELVQRFRAEVVDMAREEGGLLDLVYMNYAHGSQDPLGSYPAENVEFIRDVAARYDPKGVFQRRVPGGFKIGRVEG